MCFWRLDRLHGQADAMSDIPATIPDRFIELMDRAAYLRGRYLTSYAQCEFLLADISVRISQRFRYPVPKRVNAAKALAEGDGPLSPYADELVPMIENLSAWMERRHMLAHGFQRMFTDPSGKHAFEFRYYEPPTDGGTLQLKYWFVTIDELQNAADAINRYCSAFVALHQRIYLELDIG
jgi:hypothetical protein